MNLGLMAKCNGNSMPADLRILTRHSGQPASVRRGMVTFSFDFERPEPHVFTLSLDSDAERGELLIDSSESAAGFLIKTRLGSIRVAADAVTVEMQGGASWNAALLAPPGTSENPLELEFVESGAHYLWLRLLASDPVWPRIIEVRLDSSGGVTLWGHVQRLASGNATAPDLGWTVSGLSMEEHPRHTFAQGETVEMTAQQGSLSIRFPRAPYERRGYVEVQDGILHFLRCEAAEQVAFQETAWRSAAIALDPAGAPERTPLLEYDLQTRIAPEHFDALYGSGSPLSISGYPLMERLLQFTRKALVQALTQGDDFGNITSFNKKLPYGPVYGMNRLNHCPPIFFEAWRSGDDALRDAALLWCENMHALSLWWGEEQYGGTRYNNAAAQGEQEHANDPHFMWRTNYASHFCTKGFDAFFLAYEETGDPRMAVALDAQVNYARNHIFVNRGEARNIGDVADFMALYQYTGLSLYLTEATRLFEELRLCIGEDHLFSQGGKPVLAEVPFIDDDQVGLKIPFGKPYIMGYALTGLPSLLKTRPDVYKLPEVVRDVAAFQATAQDPLGGWRYPHPRSSRMFFEQGMEHAAQLARAVKVLSTQGEPVAHLLDAMERTLRARLLPFEISSTILTNLDGWERAAGVLEGKTIYDLYAKPEDRDPARDYTDGTFALDYATPEGLAHTFETLQVYLEHRPVERLLMAHAPLKDFLMRLPDQGLRVRALDEPLSVAYELYGTPVLELRTDLSEGIAFANCESRALSESSRECSWHIENDVLEMLSVFSGQADMAEWVHSFNAKAPGLVSEVSLKLRVVLSPDVARNSIEVLTLEGTPPSATLPGPQSVLITASRLDGQSVLGLTAPQVISWKINADDPPVLTLNLAFSVRGDGPTTVRGFVLVEKEHQLLRRALHALVPEMERVHAPAQSDRTGTYGMRAMLPAFHEARIARMDFPLAWRNAGLSFDAWRDRARNAYLASLQTPPPSAPFAPKVLAVEDRGAYEARKLAFNISADERVTAYLLVPHGEGPFPAILALHDHGAHFTIGKEKVVRPFDVSPERLTDAQQWVDQYYGGRFIGDTLAERGYVVFATDALFWGDRGRLEGEQHSAQQELAANILQMGQSWAGIVTWNDLRSAIFLQGLPEVDPERIGCIGLSMGAHRTWSLCAATDIVKAGAAICWMGDTPTLLGEGNNQTRGQSAFSMLHPGLRNLLDYPDVASIACPKPLLFYNGTEDGLFPVPGVEAAYAVLRGVYEDRGVPDRLETKLWEVPHLFNETMQDEAFSWLDEQLR